MRKAAQALAAMVCAVFLCGCSASARQSAPAAPTGAMALVPPAETPSDARMTPAERAYVGQTARTLYRGSTIEQASHFLPGVAGAHAACVRSPAGAVTGGDYTMIVLQRRVTDDYIPQAADDALILRSAADVAPCRARAAQRGFWLPVR